jgi:hypothetical protein
MTQSISERGFGREDFWLVSFLFLFWKFTEIYLCYKELCCSLNKYIRFYHVCISFVQFIDMRRLIRIVYALFCICNEITLYIVVSILYRTQELGPLYWMVTRWQIPCKWEQVRRTYLLGPTNWKAVRKCSNCKSLNLEFQFALWSYVLFLFIMFAFKVH